MAAFFILKFFYLIKVNNLFLTPIHLTNLIYFDILLFFLVLFLIKVLTT